MCVVCCKDRLRRMHPEAKSIHPKYKMVIKNLNMNCHFINLKVVHDTLISHLKDNPLAKDAVVAIIMNTPGDFTEASVRFWADLYAAQETLPDIAPVTLLPGDAPGGDPGDSVSDAGSDIDDTSPTGPNPPPPAATAMSFPCTVFRPPLTRTAPHGSPIFVSNLYWLDWFRWTGPNALGRVGRGVARVTQRHHPNCRCQRK
jgi:hypothetical protein